MRERELAIAWIALAVLFVIGLVWELTSWRSLASRGEQAAVERSRLTADIREREQAMVREMRANSALLQEMSWTATGADPTAFMRRVAELAQGSRMKITAIGPLEQQAAPQFNKSWHTIQITGPYAEVKELVARVEAERGILENVTLTEASRETAPGPPREQPGAPAEPRRPLVPATEIQAQFRMTAVELTAQAKAILERASAASGIPLGSRSAPSSPALGLPVPARAVAGAAQVRDPFTFGAQVAPPKPVVTAVEKAPSLELQGIVGFPGGFLAILDNQIVKVGDKVKGNRVEDITERAVLIREAAGTPRRLLLPDIATRAAAPPAAAPPAATPPPAPAPAPPSPRR